VNQLHEQLRLKVVRISSYVYPYPLTTSLPPVLRGNSSGQVPVYPPIDTEIEDVALSLETVHPNPRSMILESSSSRKDIVAGGILFMQVRLLYYDSALHWLSKHIQLQNPHSYLLSNLCGCRLPWAHCQGSQEGAVY